MAAGFEPASARGPRTKLSRFRESWDEFAPPDGLFTGCHRAAEEVCPVWPGQSMAAHWAIRDPVAVDGTDEERVRAFNKAFRDAGLRS